MKNKCALFVVFSVLLLVSCNTSIKTNEIPNTPTSGELTFFCDEGLYLHLKNQSYTFQKIYNNTSLKETYSSETQAIEALYKDSCKAIFTNRKLSEAELKNFNSANVYPTQSCIAINAIAVVVSEENPDSVISVDEIKNLLQGKDSSLLVVFDQTKSGAGCYAKDTLNGGQTFGKNCFAVQSTPKLVEYIASHKNTIGLMDYAWLSDKDDTSTQRLLSKIKILAVSASRGKTAYMPDQSNIKTGDYPMCRWVYVIWRSQGFNLETGFASFVAGRKGQLMFLKQGLVPSHQPNREVEINTNPL